MSQQRPEGDAESQWQQPPFEPESQPVDTVTGAVVVPGQASGRGLTAAEDRRPPSVLESTINVVNGVLWPVLIGLVFLGVGNWWLNIFAAIVASSLLGGISTELKRRRRYLPPSGRSGELGASGSSGEELR